MRPNQFNGTKCLQIKSNTSFHNDHTLDPLQYEWLMIHAESHFLLLTLWFTTSTLLLFLLFIIYHLCRKSCVLLNIRSIHSSCRTHFLSQFNRKFKLRIFWCGTDFHFVLCVFRENNRFEMSPACSRRHAKGDCTPSQEDHLMHLLTYRLGIFSVTLWKGSFQNETFT